MTSHRKDAPPNTHKQGSSKEPKHRKLTRRQRILARAVALAGVAVVAFVTAFAGNFGDHAATLVSTIGSHSTRASAQADEPVTLDYVEPEPPAGSAVVAAAAQSMILTARQLGQLNAEWLTAHGALTPSVNILVVVPA
jgi:hypothetical protein